jgi:transcriptional regulator with XRE-family HTH domain
MPTATATSARTPGVGPLLREWRQQRHLSQLDLAGTAEVSTKHLSFVETGRSKPSRELVLHLAEHLEVPLRERNALLLAAGYAPVYQQSSLDSTEMAPVRDALDRILASHEPFPAIVVDRGWDLVAANGPALAILTQGVDPALLAPPANALRVSLHPDGLAPRITNLAEYGSHILTRLHRQAQLSADPALVALGEELRAYPGVAEVVAIPNADADDPVAKLFVPLAIEHGGQTLTFFSTMSTFGTALDITVAELSIESFFPADAETAAALHASWAGPPAPPTDPA